LISVPYWQNVTCKVNAENAFDKFRCGARKRACMIVKECSADRLRGHTTGYEPFNDDVEGDPTQRPIAERTEAGKKRIVASATT
jgi:hypothetical protein